MSLRARIEHLEAERARGAIEILRMHPDGGAVVTALRDGRVVSRREVTAEEAARLAKRAITIERTYGLPTSEARDDLPPTEKI